MAKTVSDTRVLQATSQPNMLVSPVQRREETIRDLFYTLLFPLSPLPQPCPLGFGRDLLGAINTYFPRILGGGEKISIYIYYLDSY